MGRAKDIIVKPIASKDARKIIKALHYSGKVVNNSQVHFGVFLDGKCGGCLQFGPSLDKRKMLGLVEGTKWNEFLELNRMALADWLPRNGESRAISVAMRMLKKSYPWLKWVVSFADACQCGDGTIYRASGFVLIKINSTAPTRVMPDGTLISRATVTKGKHILATGRAGWPAGAIPLQGHQLKYIYFLDSTARDRLTVPVLPFSEIEKRGAKMYLGKRPVSEMVSRPSIQAEDRGSTPTAGLKRKSLRKPKKKR